MLHRTLKRLSIPYAPGARSRTPGRRGERGFTLIELLVVIAILGLLVYMVAPAALRQLGASKVKIAQQSVQRIADTLDMYKLDVGSYPSSDQGLRALVVRPADAPDWSGPYIKGGQVPLDPWNHPYLYRSPSEHEGKDFDLCSPGPDAGNAQTATLSPGGEGQICNR
jgi:general secretion pathway protein G